VVGGYANSAATKATPSVGKKDLMFMKCIVANVLFVSQQIQLGIWYSGEDSGSSFFATDKEKGFIKQAADSRHYY